MKTALPLYENGDFWVTQTDKAYEVYKTGITASVRYATIGKSLGLDRAKKECDRRADLAKVFSK